MIGVLLRRHRHRARLAALMVGSIDLLLLPYGTALGCYALWVLLSERGKALFGTPACPVKDQMRDQARAAVMGLSGVTDVDVRMSARVREAMAGDGTRASIPGVKNIIAVGAGKGGVGKTTVAVNLALALARSGSKVGMIDGDIYGPNVPIMLGLKTQLTTDGEKIIPAEKYGLQIISMGFMTGDDAPIIWRGPMLHG